MLSWKLLAVVVVVVVVASVVVVAATSANGNETITIKKCSYGHRDM